MKKYIIVLLIGMAFIAFTSVAKAQEVSIYAGGQQNPSAPDSPEPEGNEEVQDEGELASALGVDRQALYEDLMRISEELGGSPLGSPDQPSQEDY